MRQLGSSLQLKEGADMDGWMDGWMDGDSVVKSTAGLGSCLPC